MRKPRLTLSQQMAIYLAKPEYDFCVRVHPRTMEALVNKGLAKYTSGFGYQHGGIIELTQAGKDLQ